MYGIGGIPVPWTSIWAARCALLREGTKAPFASRGLYWGTIRNCFGLRSSFLESSSTVPYEMTFARQWCTHEGSRPRPVRSAQRSHRSVSTGKWESTLIPVFPTG